MRRRMFCLCPLPRALRKWIGYASVIGTEIVAVGSGEVIAMIGVVGSIVIGAGGAITVATVIVTN